MAERFFVEQPLTLGTVSLTGPEAHHLAHVLRARPGDRLYLFNGDGRQYRAVVAAVARRAVVVEVEAVEEPARELGFRLLVAAPLPRGDRAQFLVEKLTELGVTDFVPLRTARAVVQPREAHADKLRRHVIEASKQCGRNVLLRVAPPADWSDFLARPDRPARAVVAHVGGPGPRDLLPAPAGLAVAVGPEGGFTDEEEKAARRAGWEVIGLGPRILRVETAALVLAAWAQGPAPAG